MRRNPRCADSIEQTPGDLAADAFAPKLRTHKLKGDLDGVWACSAGLDVRVHRVKLGKRGGDYSVGNTAVSCSTHNRQRGCKEVVEYWNQE